jgi:hypothetical protein
MRRRGLRLTPPFENGRSPLRQLSRYWLMHEDPHCDFGFE